MKLTNYAEVSKVYEQNRWRHGVETDSHLARVLERLDGAASVLDLGCGTGFYLGTQLSALGTERARWVGLDASKEMLEIARSKLSGADLRHGRAEAMPFSDGEFHYVNTNFAFHHFEDKERALDEIVRVLRPGGMFRMHNIAPEFMTDWWVYDYFPASRALDQERFWPIRRIFDGLQARGLSTEIRVEYTLQNYRRAELLEHAERRDISNIAIIGTEDYESGLKRLREETASDPDSAALHGLALLTAIGRK
jgi:ubiquinone/menaquinone biosynthesis C-methylase UbiE